MKEVRRFVFRPFVSYFVTLSFIHLIVSSIILYIAPPGRFTNWNNWEILGISKAGWQAQHTVVGYLFIIAAVVHLVLNWKIFLSYIRGRVKKSLNRGWELLAALVLIVVVTAGVEFQWPPFPAVMNFGEQLSNSWEQKTAAETGSGTENTAVPAEDEHTVTGTGSGGGRGRMSLDTAITENGIPREIALERLKKNGITAEGGDLLRDIMNSYSISYSEIAEIITTE